MSGAWHVWFCIVTVYYQEHIYMSVTREIHSSEYRWQFLDSLFLQKGLSSDLVVHTLNAFSYNEYEKETQLIFLILNTPLHANALY